MDELSAVRRAFLDTAQAARAQLALAAVTKAWHKPSARPGPRTPGIPYPPTVGTLAGLVAEQILVVPLVLAEPGLPGAEPIPLLEYYEAVRWSDPTPYEVLNLRAGPDGDLAGRTGAAIAALRLALPAEPPGRTVHLPWGPWTLSLDDFLVSRMMELTVPADDLAFSLGLPSPRLPASGLDTVLRLLIRHAVRRPGPGPDPLHPAAAAS